MKNIFKFLLTNKLHGAMVNYTSNEPHNQRGKKGNKKQCEMRTGGVTIERTVISE